MTKRIGVIALVLVAIVSSGLISYSQIAIPIGGGAPEIGSQFGPRQVMPLFFMSFTQYDLIVLQGGGALSGDVQADAIKIKTSGGDRSYPAASITMMTFASSDLGTTEDQIVLKSGTKVNGQIQLDQLKLMLPTGQEAIVQGDALLGLVFQVQLPFSEGGEGGEGGSEPVHHPGQIDSSLRQIFQGLRGGLIRQMVISSLTKFDLLIVKNEERWGLISADVQLDSVPFSSTVFGQLNLAKDQVAVLTFQPKESVILKSGDQVTGTIQLASISVMPSYSASAAEGGAAIKLEKAQINNIIFKVQQSFFEGVGGPGFGPGPGK